jgi:uncharacterized membrane protein
MRKPLLKGAPPPTAGCVANIGSTCTTGAPHMSEMSEFPGPHHVASSRLPTSASPGIGRLEAFSDGVIAIIITIMVLELKLPEHHVSEVWNDIIRPMWPKLLAYLWSFVGVGMMWISHHHLLHTLESVPRPLAWLNLHLLFWMSLVPATTALIGEHPLLPAAVATYAFVQGASMTGFLMLRDYARRMTRSDASGRSHDVHATMLRRNLVAVAMHAAAAALSFVWLPLAYALIVGVPLLFMTAPRRRLGL